MSDEKRETPSFSLARRWAAVLNLVITAAAVAALVGMFNYLAIRHYTRFHWNRETGGELSKRTHTVLASLTNQVKVIVYFDSEDGLFPRVKALLKEYEFVNPRVQVQFIDYLRDAGAANLAKSQYNLTSANDKNVVIFWCNGRKQLVNAGALSDYDYSKLLSGEGKEVERTHFKGELLFTSAIYSVASERSPVAYFLIGNGEHLPVGADNPDSYIKFANRLHEENNFTNRPLTLSGTNEIPADCNLLVIAGSTQPIEPGDLDKIQRYFERGGRALIAFNNATLMTGRRTGLERLLENWGVDVGENLILDRDNSSSNTGLDVMPVDLGTHPIVSPLRNASVLLYMPRSIRMKRPASRSEGIKVEELLMTGPKSLVVTDIRRREIDPSQTGSKSLMVAVEKSVPGLQRGSTRLVVIGDSSLWGNQLIDVKANSELAASAANWLVNQTILLGEIPPRPIHTYKLAMTHAQLRSVQWLLLLGLPGAVLLLGLLVWVRRRN
jgi:ABC-2 type transport system permease protein